MILKTFEYNIKVSQVHHGPKYALQKAQVLNLTYTTDAISHTFVILSYIEIPFGTLQIKCAQSLRNNISVVKYPAHLQTRTAENTKYFSLLWRRAVDLQLEAAACISAKYSGVHVTYSTIVLENKYTNSH